MNITRPTLLVDEGKCRQNIRTMARKARESGVQFRPHFKTHQSADIGTWFQDEGVEAITVSSVEMGHYFAAAGWKDITIAFPYNPLEKDRINDLNARVRLNLLIESEEALEHMNENITAEVEYNIKVDVGTNRTGVQPSATRLIHSLQSRRADHRLKGLVVHAGHAYGTITRKIARKIFDASVKAMMRVRAELAIPELMFSYGDTPTCSVLEEFPGIHELRPGNFVFYDLMQYAFGACRLEEIAVAMACPVVAIHSSRNEIVIYGGAVHFSKDFIQVDKMRNYGLVVKLTENGWQSAGRSFIARLSQEHGVISADKDLLQSVKVGDLLGVIPVHSCLTADLQPYYVSLSGKKISKYGKV